jgi:saxitoxin biosynthesis operon SxtJ-like protein
MAGLIDRDREPSERELRWFGALFFGFSALVAGVLWARAQSPVPSIAVALLGGAFAGVYYAVPSLRRALLRSWIALTYPVGWLGSNIALGAFYFLVLTPIGLALRIFGRDALERRREPDRPSYWVAHRGPSRAKSYWNQY